MKKSAKIYIAGHKGLLGSAIEEKLRSEGYHNLVLRTHKELDLTRQEKVEMFFEKEKPEYVFIAAAKAGGIGANMSRPAEFIYDNLMIEANIINSSYKYGVKKLIFVSSASIYANNETNAIREEELLKGTLEKSNEAYAIAKISGIKLCEFYRKQYGCDFISAVPINLYGKRDNFSLENGHVLPMLIRKFHEAKKENKSEVIIWGTGKALREFMYAEDLADALIYLMKNYSENIHINVGTGEEISIQDLALLIKNIVGFNGEIKNDLSKSDGAPRKLINIEKLSSLGWKSKISLEEGIKKTYEWYLENENRLRY